MVTSSPETGECAGPPCVEWAGRSRIRAALRRMVLIELPVAVQHRDVDAMASIVGPKAHGLGGVKEIRVEDDRAIPAVWDADRARVPRIQEVADQIDPFIVSIEIPAGRSVHVVDQHSAGRRVEIALGRTDPEIHVHRGEIGVDRRVGREMAGVLEAPELTQRVRVADETRQVLPDLLGDLEQKRAIEAAEEEGAEAAVGVTVAEPHRGFETEPVDALERVRSEEVVDDDDARMMLPVQTLRLGAIPRWRQGLRD